MNTTTPIPFAGCYTRDYFILSDQSMINYALLAAFYLVLAAISVALNIMVVIVMVKLKRYRNASDVLIIILCLTDIGSGSLTCPFYGYLHLSLIIYGTYACALASFLKMVGYAFSLASIITIAFFTIEMYISIIQPFKPKRQPKTYIILVSASFAVISTITVIAIYVMPLEMWNLFQAIAGGTFFLVFLLLAFTQFKICKEAKKMNKNQPPQSNKEAKSRQKNVNINKIALIVLFLFGACHTPYVMSTLYVFISYPPTRFWYTYIMMWCYYFIELSVICDPIIFCLRMTCIRQKMYHLVCGGETPKSPTSVDTSFKRSRRFTSKVMPI